MVLFLFYEVVVILAIIGEFEFGIFSVVENVWISLKAKADLVKKVVMDVTVRVLLLGMWGALRQLSKFRT